MLDIIILIFIHVVRDFTLDTNLLDIGNYITHITLDVGSENISHA
jgi:hypothetical protein